MTPKQDANRRAKQENKYGEYRGRGVKVYECNEACHANGTPLRLADLLTADDTNFAHDVFGIHRHINRETGQLEDCFLPRFAVPESDIGRTFDGEVYEVKTV